VSAPNGMQLDWQELLVYLQALHAQQVGAANLEAAKWQAVATQAQRQITELTERVATLEKAREPGD